MRKIILGLISSAVIFCCTQGFALQAYQKEIRNIVLTDCQQWYKVDCSDAESGVTRVRNINIRARQGAGNLYLAFESEGDFFTVPEGSVYFEEGMYVPMVFFLRADNSNAVAEVMIYR